MDMFCLSVCLANREREREREKCRPHLPNNLTNLPILMTYDTLKQLMHACMHLGLNGYLRTYIHTYIPT